MQVVADLEVHSKYARAVSSQMVLPTIAQWGKKKGIDLLGTGDFTHPIWIREIQANLVEAGDGIYALKDDIQGPKFLLTSEISSIFSQNGRLHRIHTMVFAPNLNVVEKMNKMLLAAGCNLMSDGRPMVGLSCRQLAEIALSASEDCLIIPAHVWTPWFGFYGSKGGCDSLEEGFGEFSKYIYAVETGLSSDPAMNWRIGELENRQIVSFSDAHSPAKLGREATVFEVPEVNYENVRRAIIGDGGISYTIEFYPEEGKYHFTGHRNCGVRQTPGETRLRGTTCHVCGKPLTVGVMHRVEDLANGEIEVSILEDDYGVKWVHPKEKNRPPYVMMVPLVEILAEALEVGISSQKVLNEYEKLTQSLGPEFEILLQTKAEEIERISGAKVREAVEKVRSGDIFIDPGYDGVFGKVKIWQGGDKEELVSQKDQLGLF